MSYLFYATLNLNNHFLITVRCYHNLLFFSFFSISLYYTAIVSNLTSILWLYTILNKQTVHNKILHNNICILWLYTILPRLTVHNKILHTITCILWLYTIYLNVQFTTNLIQHHLHIMTVHNITHIVHK